MSVKIANVPEINNRRLSKKRSIITSDKLETMEKFRQRLVEMGVFEDYRLKSQNFFLRYLKAANWSVEKAMTFINNYLDIKKQYNSENIMNEVFPKDFSEKYVTFVGGHDNAGRPIAMIPAARLWNLKETINSGREDMFIRYVLKVAMTFEKMVLERDSDYGILVCDVSSLAYGNYFHKRTLEVLLLLVNMVEKISPDIIKKVYFVNAPKMFVALFNTVQRLVTVPAEIHVFDSNEKKWRAALEQVIPDDGICPEFGGICKNFVTV